MKYKSYTKDLLYSYALGTAPTLCLLEYQSKKIQEVLLSSKAHGEGVEKIKALTKKYHIPFRIDDKQIEALSKSENTYVIGIFSKYNTPLDSKKNHVALVNPSDTGNVGTIIRTMSGFACYDLAIISPAIDIWDPKVIRASMGAVFQMNHRYFSDFTTYQKSFNRTYYAFMLTDSQPLQKNIFTSIYTLVFGNEGAGLAKEFERTCMPIRIEQSSTIDSFNLSIAVGIVLYTAYIQSQ